MEFAIEHISWYQPNCYGSFHVVLFLAKIKNKVGKKFGNNKKYFISL
jgi:hypothetical protein